MPGLCNENNKSEGLNKCNPDDPVWFPGQEFVVQWYMPREDIEEMNLLDRLQSGDMVTMYATGVQEGFLTKREDLIYPCNS